MILWNMNVLKTNLGYYDPAMPCSFQEKVLQIEIGLTENHKILLYHIRRHGGIFKVLPIYQLPRDTCTEVRRNMEQHFKNLLKPSLNGCLLSFNWRDLFVYWSFCLNTLFEKAAWPAETSYAYWFCLLWNTVFWTILLNLFNTVPVPGSHSHPSSTGCLYM